MGYEVWRRRAACVGLPVALFFPERDETGSLAKARQICAGCPVKAECLEMALEQNEENDIVGIFAGTSARTRRRLRHERANGPVVLEWNRFKGKWIQTSSASGKSASIRLAEPPIE